MTRDELIAMVLKSGLGTNNNGIERFAALVAATEREACAQLCESYENDLGYGQPQQCANAIRSRGEK